MKFPWLAFSYAFLLVVSGLRLEEISKAEDDGTMTSVTVVDTGVYRAVAPNHDSYLRFTMSNACHDLNSFSYLKMKVWAAENVQFTVELKQGFDDCRLDLWPYVKEAAAALVSYYTAKTKFDGSADGQDVWIPLSHFNVDRTKIAQVFFSSVVTLGSSATTTVQFGNVEFTNDAPTITVPSAMPQNPSTSNCEKPYTLAITFDNQHSGNLLQILDTLKANNAKCTIFQIGGDLVENDTSMKRLMAEGHQVAHHTWTHPDFLELSEAEIRKEMTLTDQALEARLGVKTKWFRPPFGHQDPRVRSILNDMGYISVIWNIDSTDYFNQENGPMVWARIQARLDAMDPSRTGGVLLLHNDIKASADLVEKVIIYAQGKGFKDFLTMEECMAGKYNAFLGQAPVVSTAAPSASAQESNSADTPSTGTAQKQQTNRAELNSGIGVTICTIMFITTVRYMM